MNRDQMEGNWKQFTGKVKEQWGKLTDDDLDQIGGKREQLEGKIQERYGKSKEDARRDVDSWFDRNGW
ncbi:CsbD family protein [Pelagibacterium sp. 26DY04]|uniref:CsbD family protein n=1 Tax=unclassified Pelagibacterium TaxID=2623280 RepID=UPI002814B6BB|nr:MULTISPECIES: CsbD family protein [unclassified Pelagibacterium]WMT88427.1 CsbD family protein [Pelagibacterium sp. 26DY04]WMT90895.1 CsbD family protein [Pelagibacterium sp. H642]